MFDDKLEQDLARKSADDGDAEGHAIRSRPVNPTDTDEPEPESADGEPTDTEGNRFKSYADEPDADPSDSDDTEGHERA